MEVITADNFDVCKIRALLESAKSLEEKQKLNALFPVFSQKELSMAHKNLDDGLYDANGTLIGEKHPED